MRQHDLSIPKRSFHSNAKSEFRPFNGSDASDLPNTKYYRQATTPVAVLIVGSFLGVDSADRKKFLIVSVIVVGVMIASFGEIKFNLIGFLFQVGGVVFEATRLVMVQKLLSSAEYKMDPLVSLYYFAPVCAVMNFCVALVVELPRISMAEVYYVGLLTFLANAAVAFVLNVSVVFLVCNNECSILIYQLIVHRLARRLPWS